MLRKIPSSLVLVLAFASISEAQVLIIPSRSTGGGGSGAPTDATYIVQTANGSLSAEQALGALGTGVMLNTTTTGVVSIATTQTCTNQFVRALSDAYVATCAAVANADLAGSIAFSKLIGTDITAVGTLATWAFSAAPTITDGVKVTFNPNNTNAGINIGGNTTDPSSPVNGDMFYDSDGHLIRAYVNSAWVTLSTGGTGDVVGPASAVASNLAAFDGTTGKLIKDSGIAMANVLSIATIAQGDIFYATSGSAIAALNKDANATRYLSNTGTTNNPAWAQVNVANGITGTVPVANGGTGITALGTGVATALGVNVGSAGAFVAFNGALGTPTSGTMILPSLFHWTAAACQNTTPSIGFSLFTSNTPTAICVTGTNSTFGVARFTATAQQVQGMVLVPYDLTNTTVLLKGAYTGSTTSAGNVTWTFSYARVAAGSTLDPAWTDITVSDAAGTADQLNLISQSLTLTSLAANDLLLWKFTYTTAPTTPGNQNLIILELVPVRSMNIGG